MDPTVLILVLIVVPIGGGIAIAIAVEQRAQRQRVAALTGIARHLGGTPPHAKSMAVAGNHNAQPMTFRFTYRGSGKNRRPWTEVDVGIPPTTFAIELRTQTRTEERLAARDLVVDVITGDAAFDEAFVVEAAPADIARALLDPPLRRSLLDVAPVEVKPVATFLRVEKYGHVLEPGLMRGMVDIAARIAAGIRPAHAEADAVLEAEAPRSGTPFRAEPDATAMRARRRERADEIVELARVKERRADWNRLVGWAIIAGAIAFFALLAWLSSR